jgi:tRNA pseudouridine38-40 synthase
MAVYRLIVAYRGTAYAGWQRQSNALGVQQVLEEALAGLLGRAVSVVGAGRTDAGVHARGQAVHLCLPGPFPEKGLVFGTNHYLTADVRVMAAESVKTGFHARKHALSKEYRYHLVRARVLSPVDALFAVRAQPDLDLAAVRRATELLPGRHDFSAFALSGGAHTQPWRRILEAEWHEEGPRITFRVVGEGFLRGMVRALVGTLLEVGRGRRSVSDFGELLTGRPRAEAGPTAPPEGLILQRVDYDPLWEGPEGD